MITKREMVFDLTVNKSYQPYRIARVMGISIYQVERLSTSEDTWKPKPRKPKVKR